MQHRHFEDLEILGLAPTHLTNQRGGSRSFDVSSDISAHHQRVPFGVRASWGLSGCLGVFETTLILMTDPALVVRR
jgi:hypothetical protein